MIQHRALNAERDQRKLAEDHETPVGASFRAKIFRRDKSKNLPWILTVVCGLMFMGVFSLILPSPGLLHPDSPTYLEFSPNRTAGYPLFLSLLARFDPTYELLPLIQMVILVVSVAFLVEACHRIYQSAITWALVGSVILLNPFLWRYTGMMLTESLYTSACVLFLASIVVAIKNRPHGAYWLLVAGLFIAIAIAIRPVGYALIGAALFGSLLWKRRFLFSFVIIITPVVASVFALSAWNWSKHGVFATQVVGGYEAIGKLALLIPTDLSGQNHDVAAQIAKNLESISSRLPSSVDRSRDYYWMTYLSFNDLRTQVVFPALARATGARDTIDNDLQPVQTQLRINELASAIAIQTVLHRPIAYLQNVLVHFVALWTYPTMSDKKEQVHLHEMLCRPEFEKVYCQDGFTPVRVVVPSTVALSKDIFLTALMLLSLALPLVVLFRKNGSLLSAATAVTAVCINANYALIALVEVGLPRYSIPMWPFVCVLTAQLILLSLPRHTAV
jgi:hypothetical protein